MIIGVNVNHIKDITIIKEWKAVNIFIIKDVLS